jgi:hypothetical protein
LLEAIGLSPLAGEKTDKTEQEEISYGMKVVAMRTDGYPHRLVL